MTDDCLTIQSISSMVSYIDIEKTPHPCYKTSSEDGEYFCMVFSKYYEQLLYHDQLAIANHETVNSIGLLAHNVVADGRGSLCVDI